MANMVKYGRGGECVYCKGMSRPQKTLLRFYNNPVSRVGDMPWGWYCEGCVVNYEPRERDAPPQPATGYTKNVTPRGPVVRPEDAFPTACCEGAALNDGRDVE